MAFPIWQDNFANTTRKYFRISGGVDPATQAADGLIFYNGGLPTASGDIHLNPICAPRLRYGNPNFRTKGFYAVCDPQTFTIETSSDRSTWVSFTRDFGPDWSYDPAFAASKQRNAPVNGHFHYGMTLFWSQWGNSPSSVTPRTYRSSTWTSQTAVNITGNGGIVSFPIPTVTSYTQVRKVELKNSLGTLLWDTFIPCAPGALYYRNAYGGWDAFCIEGTIRKSVSFDRLTRKVSVSNASAPSPWPRGEFNYLTERTPRWTISTHGMTDTEIELFTKHLIPSPDVWLHDLAEDQIYPVLMETDSVNVNTYKTNGRRAGVYEFTVRLAEERIAQ